jgi:outer membrane protein TolC
MDIPRGAFATAGDLTATWREWEIGIHLSVPLPIIDRRLEPRAEARGRVLLATANVDRTKADVRTEVGEIGERLAAALEAVQAMKDVPEIIDREIGLLDKALRAGAIEMPAWSQQARRLEEVGQLFDEAVLALRRARAAWIRFEGAR